MANSNSNVKFSNNKKYFHTIHFTYTENLNKYKIYI